MTTGPFLYDDEPAPLHTATPRRRQGLLLAIFGGTALVAVLMVGGLYLLKGSPEDQAREVAGVFLAALEQGDTDTAHELLCDDERARLKADDVGPAYLGQGAGEIGTPHSDEVADGSILHVPMSWDDGSTTEWTVVREDGPRICGIAAG